MLVVRLVVATGMNTAAFRSQLPPPPPWPMNALSNGVLPTMRWGNTCYLIKNTMKDIPSCGSTMINNACAGNRQQSKCAPLVRRTRGDWERRCWVCRLLDKNRAQTNKYKSSVCEIVLESNCSSGSRQGPQLIKRVWLHGWLGRR